MTDDVRELARLLPDPARDRLPEHRHRLLREQFMEQIRQEGAGHIRPAARWHRTGLALAGGFLAVALVVVASTVVFSGSSLSVPPGVPAAALTITHDPLGDVAGEPPPFLVRYGETELVLAPQSFCPNSGSGCVSVVDPAPPSVGSPEEIFVRFPLGGPVYFVAQGSPGDLCYQADVGASIEDLGDGWRRIRPRGPAGDHLFTLHAVAPGYSSVKASLRWTTPADQPMHPSPTARIVAPAADLHAEQGVDIWLIDMGRTVQAVEATVTLTDGGGDSVVVPMGLDANECNTVLLTAPADPYRAQILALDEPLTVTVDLVLDGSHHTAVTTWPPAASDTRDLTFTPPLP